MRRDTFAPNWATQRPTDLAVIAYVEREAIRSADFQGLGGKLREAYLAGQSQGASAAMALLRETGILKSHIEKLADGSKTRVFQF